MDFTLISKNFDQNELSLLFLNGGGHLPFSPNHKLVKYFISEFPTINVFNVTLPGHCKFAFDRVLNAKELLEFFQLKFNILHEKYDVYKFGLIGFSLGGLLSLKVIESFHPNCKFALVYGCTFFASEKTFNKLKYFASQKFFEDMRWMGIMKKNHGEGWNNLIQSISVAFYPNSPLFVNLEKIGKIISPVLMLLGENEEIFDKKENLKLANGIPLIKILSVNNASHFEYTTKSWGCSKEKLQNNLDFLLLT